MTMAQTDEERAKAACANSAAKSAADRKAGRQTVEQIHGVGVVGGCAFDDASGLAELRVDYAGGSDASGEICVDPPVRVAWACAWDTRELAPGEYVVTITAVDHAGNRATFDQTFEVVPPPRPRAPRVDVAPPVEQPAKPPAADVAPEPPPPTPQEALETPTPPVDGAAPEPLPVDEPTEPAADPVPVTPDTQLEQSIDPEVDDLASDRAPP
jgi:hypothetical protein